MKQELAQTIGEIEAVRWHAKLFWAPTLRNNPPNNASGWKSHWSEAILRRQQCFFWLNQAFMSTRSSRQARQELQETRDFKQALENFPNQLRFERLMLNHLADNPEDFVGAFQRLPLKLQQLFVQAHQSYLFNRFLSERVKHGYSLNKAESGGLRCWR